MEPSIYSISVKNFKSLRDTGVLNLKPITLLVGPNSSGKTALLQTILVLKQTLESRNIETPLVLRGKYVDLSSFKDIVFHHNIEEDIEISLGIRRHQRLEREHLKPFKGSSLMKFKIGYDAKSERLINKGIEFSIPEINLSITEKRIEVVHKELITSYEFRRKYWIRRRNFLYLPMSLLPIHFYLRRIQLFKEKRKKLLDEKTQLEKALKEKWKEKKEIE